VLADCVKYFPPVAPGVRRKSRRWCAGNPLRVFCGGSLWRLMLALLFPLVAASCSEPQAVALGTLEWDRIALPAPAAEKIVEIQVREGQRVTPGQVLLQLEPRQTRARLRSAEAAVARQAAALEELNVGPRVEAIARARAAVEAAQAEARDQQADYRRLQELGKKNYASQSDIDAARAQAESALAQVQVAQEQLLELERGTRVEEIEQGQAALVEARAQAQAQRVLLEKLTVRAPRAGIVDSIPFKLGDEAPVGGSLVVMLAGETPYARVYVPQRLRLHVQVGGNARVYLEGLGQEEGSRSGPYAGEVRMVRNEPSFTPYYALTGDDVTRLSYIAEIQLGADAARLPAGLPLRAVFPAGAVQAAESSAQPPASRGAEETVREPEARDLESPRYPPAEEHEPYDGEK